MANEFQTLIDKIIQEARERGEFDLPHHKGKKLQDEPAEVFAGDRAMAHKVLKNSGNAPPFLMKKREIDAKLDEERNRLVRYAMRRRRLHDEAVAVRDQDAALSKALDERAEQDWAWAVTKFEEAIPKLNKDIELFNLMNQIPAMFKMKIRIEWEIERAEKAILSQLEGLRSRADGNGKRGVNAGKSRG